MSLSNKEKSKKYYQENKEKETARYKQRNKTAGGKYTQYKCNANRRNLPFNISLEYFKTFWQKPCYYCGDPIDTIGLDRIDSDLGYEEGNLRSCCAFCNYAKSDNTENYFKDKILKIAKKILEN
jgi:hypothetical protein